MLVRWWTFVFHMRLLKRLLTSQEFCFVWLLWMKWRYTWMWTVPRTSQHVVLTLSLLTRTFVCGGVMPLPLHSQQGGGAWVHEFLTNESVRAIFCSACSGEPPREGGWVRQVKCQACDETIRRKSAKVSGTKVQPSLLGNCSRKEMRLKMCVIFWLVNNAFVARHQTTRRLSSVVGVISVSRPSATFTLYHQLAIFIKTKTYIKNSWQFIENLANYFYFQTGSAVIKYLEQN